MVTPSTNLVRRGRIDVHAQTLPYRKARVSEVAVTKTQARLPKGSSCASTSGLSVGDRVMPLVTVDESRPLVAFVMRSFDRVMLPGYHFMDIGMLAGIKKRVEGRIQEDRRVYAPCRETVRTRSPCYAW